jgi:hypothetical protein
MSTTGVKAVFVDGVGNTREMTLPDGRLHRIDFPVPARFDIRSIEAPFVPVRLDPHCAGFTRIDTLPDGREVYAFQFGAGLPRYAVWLSRGSWSDSASHEESAAVNERIEREGRSMGLPPNVVLYDQTIRLRTTSQHQRTIIGVARVKAG